MNHRIAEIREAKGKTQADLAKLIHVSEKTVWNWENGKSCPNAEQIWDCAVVLETTPNDILGWKGGNDIQAIENIFESELIECYRDSTPERQDRILDTARDAAAMSKDRTEGSEYEAQRLTA